MGFIASVPIPKKTKDAPTGCVDASFGLGPQAGARVASPQSPILRLGRRSMYKINRYWQANQLTSYYLWSYTQTKPTVRF